MRKRGYTKVRDRFGTVKFRENSLNGHVQFDLENPNPAWSPAYIEWLASQAIRKIVEDREDQEEE